METWQVIIVVGLVIAAGLIVMPMLGDDDKDQENINPTPTPTNEIRNESNQWYAKATADNIEINSYEELNLIWTTCKCYGFKLFWDRIEYQAVNTNDVDRVLLYSITDYNFINYEDKTMLVLTVGSSQIEIPCVIFKPDDGGNWAQVNRGAVVYTKEKTVQFYAPDMVEKHNASTPIVLNENIYYTEKEGYVYWDVQFQGMYELPHVIQL